jgi:hypothetical protein
VHAAHRGQQHPVVARVLAGRLGDRDLGRQLLQRRQELVQRRVDEPHRHRLGVHGLEDADEVLALQR